MIYWDTSAIVRFIFHRKEDEISGITRTHTLAELFSALTGSGWVEILPGGVRRQRRMGTRLAAKTIKGVRERLSFVELTVEDVEAALDDAANLGVQGGGIHDLLHARAAEKAKADEFWTADKNDFARLVSIPIKQVSED